MFKQLSARPGRAATVVAAAAALGLAVPAGALAHDGHHGHSAPAVPAPPTSPTRADQIQNIDQVRTAIKGYYSDTATSTPDPVDGATTLHQFSPAGAYAHETRQVARRATAFLVGHTRHQKTHHAKGHRAKGHQQKQHARIQMRSHGKKAIVFDVDDTTLNTYSYEIYSNFVYNPTSNAAFVNAGSATVFPAVPGMPGVEAAAVKRGYTVFFITGRPADQLPGTEANLTDAGYTYDAANIYLKDQTKPWLSSCAPSCTTIQYKSLTRKYIESQGYDIVANFGDQYSDLKGGYADKRFKLPNPMYYLP